LPIFDRKKVTTLYHIPYPPDLSPPDYFLFSKLKMEIKGVGLKKNSPKTFEPHCVCTADCNDRRDEQNKPIYDAICCTAYVDGQTLSSFLSNLHHSPPLDKLHFTAEHP
jgi:hypothetical protein